MDSSTIIIIIIVLALLALYLFRRSRPAPRGTYDEKRTRSSGSIGGGTRAYDDPKHRSRGSIGGGQRSYDSPEHKSRGSIGSSSAKPDVDVGSREDERTDRVERSERVRSKKDRSQDDDRFTSGGSFGG